MLLSPGIQDSQTGRKGEKTKGNILGGLLIFES